MTQNHDNFIEEYLEFSKFQRIQHLKTIQNCFKGIVENRLLEGTYTSEEVEGILRDLRDCICSEVESELISISHMNVLLLKQLFGQTEKLGLTLSGSISEMQNGDLLEKIRIQDKPAVTINVSSDVTLQGDLQDKLKRFPMKSHQICDCEAAHENIKKILSKKNELLKSLREKLLQYEEQNRRDQDGGV